MVSGDGPTNCRDYVSFDCRSKVCASRSIDNGTLGKEMHQVACSEPAPHVFRDSSDSLNKCNWRDSLNKTKICTHNKASLLDAACKPCIFGQESVARVDHVDIVL
jgi:hypothetical protein